MNQRINKHLADIQESISQIETFLGKVNNFFEFQQNIMLKKAVERNLEIIGESLNTILKLESNIQITNARQIVDLRNKLIHEYDKIDDVIIWGIVKKHLVLLKEEINNILLQSGE
ncbi:MAG: hypothetical protein A2X61_15050 [Ignavibacteria bacterium GWB2_35_12]|nr:MAG: hypothetical protein A2X61_15050 [Ignavibacteria bacterium GWB2_35_12]OGU86103.1 MAG: hypothetical protein A2220_06625 [Ignavibacteria bacterium RIFOXYA2_FULL_35_10]OGV24358.1 MAG: hypothetical protein A2475_05305 [Ignavibacteria bacterium RIFOXYC2_FULL_35_21]